MKVIISLFVVALATVSTIAQSGYLDGKYPLDSGNVWVYYRHSSGFDPYDFSDETITIDTIQYDLVYNRNTSVPMHLRLREDGYYMQRLDSSSINEPNNEQIYYKKNTVIGDSWTNIFDTTSYTSVVTDTFPAYVFDTVVVGKNVHIDAYLNIFNQVWTEEFGLLYVEDFYGPLCYLAGCIINGIRYGDTSTTSVESEQVSFLPNKFELFHNYPNPFNPTTVIRYTIKESGLVSLKVFDVLGEEVGVLVNEVKSAGIYQVKFNGTGLPSGVYIYSLKVNDFIFTRKMLLLK